MLTVQDTRPGNEPMALDQLWQAKLDADWRLTVAENKLDYPRTTTEIVQELKAYADTKIATAAASPVPTPSSSLLSNYMLAEEMEQAWKYAYKNYFKKFTFVLGVLSTIRIWTTSAMTLELFNKTFTFGGGVLSTIVMTRISDGRKSTKTFTFVGGVLSSIDVAIT